MSTGPCWTRIVANRAALLLLAATAGCRLLTHAPTLPEEHRLVRQSLVIHSDFPLVSEHPMLEELTAERDAVGERLRIAVPEEPIPVYLFETASAYHAYIGHRFPEFPQRRAFFVETAGRPAIYAYFGQRVAEDLRHEVAHGYLHAAVPDLPLWLDEGLAEYFEVPPGQHGFHDSHVSRLVARLDMAAWKPALRRLESIESVDQMEQDDYAEAWAWVHFLLETSETRRRWLRAYVHDLSAGGDVEPLSH
ncbi:MAG: DUF1570 domain-containing protein, partial [Pirellulales bacterium]